MTMAIGIPTFRRRILSRRLKEEEAVKTGDWGSNKQLVWYPLTIDGKVAMLRVAEREQRRKGKNEEGKE